jgi:AcrR family transcriptional regulator
MAAPTRTPQSERRARTIARLLDATIDSLAEVGYAGTNARAVAKRAGVSQGAATYHFPSRADLIVAALEELAARSEVEIRKQIPALPRDPARRRLEIIDLLRTLASGSLFVAWVRLWFASAEDAELREAMRPVERRAWQRIVMAVIELLPELADDPFLRERLAVALSILRGYGLQQHFDPVRDTRSLDLWPVHRASIALIFDANPEELGVSARGRRGSPRGTSAGGR